MAGVRTFSGLMPNLEDTISARMRGQGLGLDQGYQDLENVMMREIGNRGAAARRQMEERAFISGTGRAGSTGADLAGLESDLGFQRARTSADVGFNKMNALNAAIENAMKMGLSVEELLGNRFFEFERLNEARRQFDANQPGVGSAIGNFLQMGAGLLGAGGAFPLVSERINPVEQMQMDWLESMMASGGSGGGGWGGSSSPDVGRSYDYFGGIG